MSITTHRVWREVLPYIRVVIRHQGQYGMVTEAPTLENLPDSLIDKVLAAKMHCVRCGDVINPFRQRAKQSDDNRSHNRAIYISSTCRQVGDKAGCSRGTAASQEKQMIIASLNESQMIHIPRT